MNGILQDLFTNQAIRKVLYRVRYLLAIVLLVPLARYMRPEWLRAAVVLSLLGQVIQGWCFAALVKNRELSVRGPYVLVRNPMYLGRYFLILGFICLLGRWEAVVVYTVVYYPYMRYRVMREEKRLRRIYPVEFERYCGEVRRFLPSLRKLGDPAVRFFDWTMFLENNGHWNVLLTLAAYVAVTSLHFAAFT